MSLTLRTDFGCTEAIIDDDCGLKRFYEVANILTDDLEIRFTNKEDDFDTLTWDFVFRNHILTLHYNIQVLANHRSSIKFFLRSG